jgi:hypothetical protein
MSISTITPTTLSHQRAHALARANRVRHQRRLLRERIARLVPPDGAAMAESVLLRPPDFALTMTVERLLSAVQGFGSVRVRAIARAHEESPLGALADEERAAIASACQDTAASLRGRRRIGRHDPTQALRALAGADRVRLARVNALRKIAQAPTSATGAWRAAALINSSSRLAELDGLALKAIVEAIPGVRKSTAWEIMQPLSLSDSTRLSMLSRTRAASIASALISRYSRLARPTSPTTSASSATRSPRPFSTAA